MTETSLDESKVAVIQSLQARMTARTPDGSAEREPGSSRSRAIERAIDYALSPRREASAALLEADVLRNAHFAERRSRASEARAMVDMARACAPRHKAFDGRLDVTGRTSCDVWERSRVRTTGPGGRVCGTAIVESTTPEHIAVVADLEERLRATVAAEGDSRMTDVLNGMLAEETVAESSKRLGVPTRTVDRLRAKVRLRALIVLSPEDEATVRCAWEAA